MAWRSRPADGNRADRQRQLQTSAGDAVQWDRAQALALFNALKAGKPVPAGLLTGTKVGWAIARPGGAAATSDGPDGFRAV